MSSSPSSSQSAWTLQNPQDEQLLRLEKNIGRRRFNDDQVKYLERMFEKEASPELHVKQQLANKLGLLPRQVAIWFQNKRARSKSRQIEKDYNLLKANYQELTSKFDSLKKQNRSLHIQVQRLRELTTGHTTQDLSLTTDEMPRFVVLETCTRNLCKSLTKNCAQKAEALPKPQTNDDCFASAGNKCSFQTDDLLEKLTCSNSQWWDL